MKMRKDKIILSRTLRILIYVVLLFGQLAVNTSGGILASASKTIKKQLNLTNKEFGLFGTFFGFGRVSGSLLFMLLINRVNRKYFLGIVFLCKGSLLIAFKFTHIRIVLLVLRGLIGICHMIPTIYTPVWIDQFGLKEHRMELMSILQVFMPGGKVVGYFLNILYGQENWQNGFFTEGIFFGFAAVFILSTPDNYFSSKLVIVKDEDGTEHAQQEEQRTVSIFEEHQKPKKEQNKLTYFQELKIILRSKLFIHGALARSILLGVNTAFHYWISDYMNSGLEINSPKVIFLSYIIMSIAGPVGGVAIGFLISHYFGGYEKKPAALILIFCHLITSIFGILIPFMPGLISFCAVVMLYLAFSSATLPILQGILITSVSLDLKGTAFSVANLVTMIFTSGPGPFFYGVVEDRFHEKYKNMGMLAIMLVCCIGIIPVAFMGHYRLKNFNELEGKGPKVELFDKKKESVEEGEKLKEIECSTTSTINGNESDGSKDKVFELK